MRLYYIVCSAINRDKGIVDHVGRHTFNSLQAKPTTTSNYILKNMVFDGALPIHRIYQRMEKYGRTV